VKQSDGHIEVESALNKGTRISIYLPAYNTTKSPGEKKHEEIEVSRGNETILLVEDEEVVRHMIHKILTKRGYTVHVADSPSSALNYTQSLGSKEVELLITDLILPDMNGKKLAEKLCDHFTDMKVLFISGYTEDRVFNPETKDSDTPFLQKPFTPNALVKRVKEILDTL
jgi:DNA-binding response OmpR family regulator